MKFSRNSWISKTCTHSISRISKPCTGPFLGSQNCVPIHFLDLKTVYWSISWISKMCTRSVSWKWSGYMFLRSKKWIGTQFWDPRNGSGTQFWDPRIGAGTHIWDPTITRKNEFLPFFSKTLINLLSRFIHLWSVRLALQYIRFYLNLAESL